MEGDDWTGGRGDGGERGREGLATPSADVVQHHVQHQHNINIDTPSLCAAIGSANKEKHGQRKGNRSGVGRRGEGGTSSMSPCLRATSHRNFYEASSQGPLAREALISAAGVVDGAVCRTGLGVTEDRTTHLQHRNA